MLLGVAFSLFSFSLLFSSISCFVYHSYLGQHASLLAYTGYPGLRMCMTLERSMDFPWISMCPSRTDLGKQTNKQESQWIPETKTKQTPLPNKRGSPPL